MKLELIAADVDRQDKELSHLAVIEVVCSWIHEAEVELATPNGAKRRNPPGSLGYEALTS